MPTGRCLCPDTIDRFIIKISDLKVLIPNNFQPGFRKTYISAKECVPICA